MGATRGQDGEEAYLKYHFNTDVDFIVTHMMVDPPTHTCSF